MIESALKKSNGDIDLAHDIIANLFLDNPNQASESLAIMYLIANPEY